jgi:hypothetical protein
MIGFIESPNLPKGKVRRIICGELCPQLKLYFESNHIEMLMIEPNIYIDPAVKYHADTAVIHLGGNRILLDRNQQILGSVLEENGFEVHYTADRVKGEYPFDIALNFTIIGKNFLGKLNYADKKLRSLTEDYNHLFVKQGYCKCSCLVVNENAIITDDKSIYDIAAKNCIDCLLIAKGDVSLDGHEYGFIGGASGKISDNEILFFGDITKHRDYKKIADFIEKHGCKIISLDFPLTDFGGIVPITEEV